MQHTEIEIWKDIPEYAGYYQASNLGRLKRLKGKSVPETILSLRRMNKGYKERVIRLKGKQKYIYVHRLIASTFIPNPNNKKEVNHINGIKTDNRAINLEWVTQQENVSHAHSIGIAKHKEVINLTTNTKYHSITIAAKDINGNTKSLNNALNRDNNTYKGFKWRYV